MTLDLAARTAILLSLGLIAGRLLSPASAATRHAFRRHVIAAALALPVLGALAPAWSIPAALGSIPLPSVVGRATAEPAFESAAGTASDQSVASETDWARTGSAFMSAVWLTGAGVVSLNFLLAYLRSSAVRRRSSPAPIEWQTTATRVARRLGLPTVPLVRVSSEVPGPLVSGLTRPAVLVPDLCVSWSERRRHATLLHELSHVRRRDLHAQAMAQALCALHWFNPLAWLSARVLTRERELACDDAVLCHGIGATAYAGELLAIAASALHGPRGPVVVLPMARRSEMDQRIRSLLGMHRRHRSRVSHVAIPAVVLTLGFMVAGAGAQPGSPDRMPRVTSTPGWLLSAPRDDQRDLRRHLAAQVSSADEVERKQAALGLAMTPGNEVVPALLQALTDADDAVRERAAVGLAWRRHPDIVPALVDAATDPVPGVREKVLVALALSGDERADAVLEAARTDPSPDVRKKVEKLALLR